MKILVGLIEHIGDIIACEPVSRYLRKAYPDAKITWAVSKAYRELIDTNPNVDETVIIDCLTDWIKKANHEKFDHVVDLHVNFRVCECCRIPLLKKHGNPLVNAHEWFDFGSILQAFSIGAGLPPLSASPRIYIDANARTLVDALDLPANYCVIHRESNDAIKDWEPQKWAELVSWLQREQGIAVVEVGSLKKQALPSPLEGTIDLVNKTPLLATAEVIRRAKFFIGIDSGPAHMANAVGVPGVILLGRIGVFRNYNPFSGHFSDNGSHVKIVRNLTGPVCEISVSEVQEATAYLSSLISMKPREDADTIPIEAGGTSHATAEDRALVLQSGMFDAAWYSVHIPEVDGSEALDHFLSIGGSRGISPSQHFDSQHYLTANADVAKAGLNPLVHYLKFGRREGRSMRVLYQKPPSAYSSTELAPHWRSPTLETEDSVQVPEGQLPQNEVPRVFAFYLPQFHPIAENNWAHGTGFTEWTNVIKAEPLFPGHYQPRIPGELGYYDLRSLDVMKAQIDLALKHGISGFCFYYYYFQGKKLLYKPIENYIKSDIKAPFFFLWANENWSKRWDGGDKEVIIAQNHSPEDDILFIQELITTFQDERYEKVDGKPILMVYKSHLFPDINTSTDIWREEAKRHGFPGLYLVMVDDWSQEPTHPRALGFDAAYEIPGNTIPENVLSDHIAASDLPKDFEGRIVDYRKFASFHTGRPLPEYRRHRTVMLPWDNTPRYASRAIVHVNTENDAYRIWLTQAMLDTYRYRTPDERIVFLHSWNEWCEGTYVEPDGRNGRRYLEETKAAIDDVRDILALDPTGTASRALATLRRVAREKDEGAFRVVQAAKIQTRHIFNELQQTRATLTKELESERTHRSALLKSISWRLTAPIRGLRKILARL